MESDTIIDKDETLQESLSAYCRELERSVEGFRPKMTLVFCPEKDLVLRQQHAKEEDEGHLVVEETKFEADFMATVKVIAEETLVEEEAMRQLNNAARLKGCVEAFGMPDLHPGKGIPIGAAIIT